MREIEWERREEESEGVREGKTRDEGNKAAKESRRNGVIEREGDGGGRE